MEMQVAIAGRQYRVELDSAQSLAVPLDFDGPQPSFFGAPRASSTPLRLASFAGDTRAGGSCNVAELHLTPHCNGTHVECVGHIVDDPVPLAEILKGSLFPARVVTVAPVPAGDSGERYGPAMESGDRLITRPALEEGLRALPCEESTALIVRTLPNDAAKLCRVYEESCPPPFFSTEAMAYLVEAGIEHLLVDLPSIDRMHDDGRLANHRLFWDLPASGHALDGAAPSGKTVTEMIFVPDDFPDGLYLLDIGVPAFVSDAAPCRPVIYPLIPAEPAGSTA